MYGVNWLFCELTDLWIYDGETVEGSIHVGARHYTLTLTETNPFRNVRSIEEYRDITNTLIDSFNKQKYIKEQIHANLDQLPDDHFQKKLFEKFHTKVIKTLDRNPNIQEDSITDDILETAVAYREMIREKEQAFGRIWDIKQRDKEINSDYEPER